MCGIAGIHRRTNKPVSNIGTLADELLLQIEPRGRDATGYLAMLDTGRVQMEKQPVSASRFIGKRTRFQGDARTLLLHTRFATVGAKTAANAHPVVSGRCAAIHNGTIYNHREIFAGLGLPRKAEVDSEVIPAVVDYAGWDQAAEALSLLEGGAATAIVNAKRPEEVILARLRDYPLVYMVTRDLVVWASTRTAIERAWLLTYKRPTPATAEWHEMPEHTLVRVNGKLTTEQIPTRKPKPTKPAAAPKGKGKRATTKRRARARKAAARTPQLTIASTLRTYEPEPWMDDEVAALMRQEGYTRDEAEEAIYGMTLTRQDDYADLINGMF